MGSVMRTLAVCGALTTVCASIVQAQGRPLSAAARQDLNFGMLIRGVPVAISRFDAANAGHFEIRGRRQSEVQVILTLPANLTAGAGALLPLEFSAVDGGIAVDRTVGGTQSFDPNLSVTVVLPNNGKAYVYLGGTVRPGPQQPIGAYSATITLTAAYTGN